jgi:hypothetical protein
VSPGVQGLGNIDCLKKKKKKEKTNPKYQRCHVPPVVAMHLLPALRRQRQEN